MKKLLKWGAIGIVGIIAFVVVIGIIAGEEPPHKATPEPGIVKFKVIKEWDIGADGWGAELLVDDSATKQDVMSLGEWLLAKAPEGRKVYYRIYDSEDASRLDHIAGISNLFSDAGEVWWVADLPTGPTPEMLFDELKSFAISLEYEELYRNMDKYSVDTWLETGSTGDPPLIYFRGEIASTERRELLGETLFWVAQLILPGNDSIVFGYSESQPTLMVGDKVELIAVCTKLESYKTVGAGIRTMPYCPSWQERILSSPASQ